MSFSPSDPKAGERTYYANLGEVGLAHAAGKPYNDPRCGIYLTDMGMLLQMLEPAPKRVLDLGCGTGWTSRLLGRAGYQVTGVDIAPEAVEIARRLAAEEGLANVTFELGDYEGLTEEGRYDYVLFYDALHHAEDERVAVRAAARALRPGGAMFCFEPGAGHSRSEGSRHAVEKYGVHEKDMPPDKIQALGRAAGFSRCVQLPAPEDLARVLYARNYRANPPGLMMLAEKLWGLYRVVQRTIMSGRRGGVTILWK